MAEAFVTEPNETVRHINHHIFIQHIEGAAEK